MLLNLSTIAAHLTLATLSSSSVAVYAAQETDLQRRRLQRRPWRQWHLLSTRTHRYERILCVVISLLYIFTAATMLTPLLLIFLFSCLCAIPLHFSYSDRRVFVYNTAVNLLRELISTWCADLESRDFIYPRLIQFKPLGAKSCGPTISSSLFVRKCRPPLHVFPINIIQPAVTLSNHVHSPFYNSTPVRRNRLAPVSDRFLRRRAKQRSAHVLLRLRTGHRQRSRAQTMCTVLRSDHQFTHGSSHHGCPLRRLSPA
jgi:hypothetical protein